MAGYCINKSDSCEDDDMKSLNSGCKGKACKCCYKKCKDEGCLDIGGSIINLALETIPFKHVCTEENVSGNPMCRCCTKE